MSTNDMTIEQPQAAAREEAEHHAEADASPRSGSSIVPRNSIAGSALVAVIAIMAFLASMALGAVVLVRAAASEWQSAVAREVTIQIRPADGRDLDAEVAQAVGVARAVAGVADVRPFTREESARLLEPWLGAGLALDELPVPRMIIVKIAPGGAPDLTALRKALAERVAGASLDDHRGWVERMRVMSRTAVAVGIGVLGLVLAATMLSISFATRGAMASNKPVVEVLHFVGAKDSFIAAEFQQHFLFLGLKGGAIGGSLAMLAFLLAGFLSDRYKSTAGEEQVAALFGSFALGPEGYAAVVGLVVLFAAVTASTSRLTVQRTLATLE